MKIQVLDGLRGYAAMMIVLAHIPQVTATVIGDSVHSLIDFSRIAYLGVDIFFVLSGFLITRILIREKEQGRLSFKRFYLKRSLRIFPTYYLTVLVVGLLINWENMGYVAAYVSNYFFSINFDPNPMRHTWSLAVEEHFYLIWPFLIYSLSLARAKQLIVWGTPIFVLVNILLIALMFSQAETHAMIYRASQIRVLTLAAGSAIAFYELKLTSLTPKQICKTGLILLFSTLLGLTHDRLFVFGTVVTSTMNLFLFGTISVSLFLLVLQLEKRDNFLRNIFTNRPVVYLGMISYGIYLYHYPILYAFGYTAPQIGNDPISLFNLFVLMTVVIGIPALSYSLIEKRILALKEKIADRM